MDFEIGNGGPDLLVGSLTDSGRLAAVELSVTNPLSQATVARAACEPLSAAEVRVEVKRKKYADFAERHNMDNRPVVMETTGGFSDTLRTLIKDCAAKARAHNSSSTYSICRRYWSTPTFEVYWKQRLAVCLRQSSFDVTRFSNFHSAAFRQPRSTARNLTTANNNQPAQPSAPRSKGKHQQQHGRPSPSSQPHTQGGRQAPVADASSHNKMENTTAPQRSDKISPPSETKSSQASQTQGSTHASQSSPSIISVDPSAEASSTHAPSPQPIASKGMQQKPQNPPVSSSSSTSSKGAQKGRHGRYGKGNRAGVQRGTPTRTTDAGVRKTDTTARKGDENTPPSVSGKEVLKGAQGASGVPEPSAGVAPVAMEGVVESK
jgi:hypothetical protein